MAGASGPWFVWAGFGALSLAVGILLLRVTYRLARRWRHLGDLETSDVAGVEPGDVVAVRGTAAPVDGTVRAAFAGVDALVRRTRIARRRRSSTERGGSRWDWYHDGYAAVPFVVEDATGSIRVSAPASKDAYGDLAQFRRSIDPGGVEFVVEPDDERPEEWQRYEEEYDLRHPVVDTETAKRVRERTVEPGEEVYVVGNARVSDDGELVVSGRAEPDLFLVTEDYDGVRSSQRRATRTEGLVVGLFGTVATLVGAGALALGLLLGPL